MYHPHYTQATLIWLIYFADNTAVLETSTLLLKWDFEYRNFTCFQSGTDIFTQGNTCSTTEYV